MTDVSIPAPSDPYFTPDEIILYGVELNDGKQIAHLAVGIPGTELQITLASKVKIKGSTVLAYGYAFEGHCYRLDRNRIFIVTSAEAEDAKGCGFDNSGYKMWRITAAEQILEISTNFGDAKTLILDAQLPGKRSPSSYAITLRMAHRNGRLNND